MNKPTVQTTPGQMQVPLLDLTQQYESLNDELTAAIGRVMKSGRYIGGPELTGLESEIADFCGTPHAVGCASGTDALILSLRALGIGPGDEVVTPSYSFFASASCAHLVGAEPVFCDILPDTYNLDPELLEAAITPRTKAVIVVHLFGQCADMEPISAICKKHGLPLIEDAAQSLGAEWNGRRAGSMGDLGCFSFFPSKNLGAAGDGGMVTCRDDALADRVRLLRMHGAHPKYHHEEVGLNSRLDALQAAILRVKLPKLGHWAQGRRTNADMYREKLSGAPVELPVARAGAYHVYNQFVIRSRSRDGLRAHLQSSGIGTEIYYPEPLHLQPCFKGWESRKGKFPVAEAAALETLALPVFPDLTEEQITYVADRIREYSPT
jgi:dTDP-4-amino-4,6-dideoxygalactose transaminase